MLQHNSSTLAAAKLALLSAFLVPRLSLRARAQPLSSELDAALEGPLKDALKQLMTEMQRSVQALGMFDSSLTQCLSSQIAFHFGLFDCCPAAFPNSRLESLSGLCADWPDTGCDSCGSLRLYRRTPHSRARRSVLDLQRYDINALARIVLLACISACFHPHAEKIL
jgi:hypothetical protein